MMRDHHGRPEKRLRFLVNRTILTLRGSVSHVKVRHRITLVVLLTMVGVLVQQRVGGTGSTSSDNNYLSSFVRWSPHLFTDEETEQNSLPLQRRRQRIEEACNHARPQKFHDNQHKKVFSSSEATAWREELNRAVTRGKITSNRLPVSNQTACRWSFFDFGANVGDSLGKFISVGIPSCDETHNNNTTSINKVHVQQPSLQVVGGGGASKKVAGFASYSVRTNRVVQWASQQMKETAQTLEGRVLQPEHYCYFGIEGNPVFTEHLLRLEDAILRMNPRPVRLVHFFTETVGTAQEGPTVLYLDTKNQANNYWGSSLLHSHRDVQASANKDGQVYQAQVQGVTLTTLIRQYVLHDHGSHVMVKIDIEGSEYGLLNEARDSGILCELTEKAVRVDLLVEVHSKKIVGPLDEMEIFRKEVRRDLEQNCGVNLWLTLEAD